MLSLENVSIYSNQRCILKPTSFSVTGNSVVLIYGPSGVGKSTLFNFLAGYLSQDKKGKWRILNKWIDNKELKSKGKLILDGMDITNNQPNNRDVGLVAQSGAIYSHMSALENIAFPLKCKGMKQLSRFSIAREIARQVKLSELILENKAGTLSGGEQQRVAIAKMIAKRAKLLLLDEPFAHLDPFLKEELFAFVVDLVKSRQNSTEKSAFIISHDCMDIRYADKVLLIVEARDCTNNVLLLDINNGVLQIPKNINSIQEEWIDKLDKSLVTTKSF